MQPQINTRRNRDYQHISQLMKKTTTKPVCKRCNKNQTVDIICQSCKNELLSHFEASSDWQMAFEMEKATLIASRFRGDETEDNEFN
ncbi:hypothetical protein ES705_28360 [subsurface metagenome]